MEHRRNCQEQVSITFDKSGDLVRFKADDIDYYTSANNQGYEGKLKFSKSAR